MYKTSQKKEMTLLFVGVGSPLSGLYNTSILINERILLDAPPGIDKKLVELNHSLRKVDYVFISHLHGDHILGLPQLLLNMRMLKRAKPLYIVGPRKTESLINSILRWTFKGEEKDIIERSKATFIPVSGDTLEMNLNKLRFEAFKLSHANETNYGYLLYIDNKTIGYTGDTGPCENLGVLIQKADVIITDMTFKKTCKKHLGVDYIKKVSREYSTKWFYAVHRGKEIENMFVQIKGVTLPMDGDRYEV